MFLIYMGAMILKQSRIATAWDELQELEKTLTHFKVVFAYLESRKCQNTPGLAEICAPFVDKGKRPSTEMKRLGRLAAALGLRTNPILWFLVHLLMPWDFYFTVRSSWSRLRSRSCCRAGLMHGTSSKALTRWQTSLI